MEVNGLGMDGRSRPFLSKVPSSHQPASSRRSGRGKVLILHLRNLDSGGLRQGPGSCFIEKLPDHCALGGDHAEKVPHVITGLSGTRSLPESVLLNTEQEP